jgi:dihydrolipoamide dehydrogenase
MPDRFDAIVLGAGPGGEVALDRLRLGGLRVAVVERELIGGECAYWACVPSKTLLRPPEVRDEAARAAGVGTPDLDLADTLAYRDFMVRNLDDARQVAGYEEGGVTVVKAEGRLAGPGRVEAGGEVLEADHVIVATGSDAVIPPIQGLADIDVWTNREVTGLKEIPGRAVVIGGGPVGLESAQFLARFGCAVTVVEGSRTVLARETAEVGERLGELLGDEGITLRTGVHVSAVRRDGGATAVEIDDDTSVTADVVIVATGRRPRVHDIGLETVGIEPARGGLEVDDRCRVAEGLWAVGDVTGVALFTHVAKYQGRVVADNILGKPRTATYGGVPRVVFTDPEVAAVGLSAEAAREQGMDVATVTLNIPETIARPWTYERDPRGWLGIVADRRRRVLVGAWAVAPLAGEWIHTAALAVRAEVPIDVLLDGIAQFPTYSESYLYALERLEL